MKKYEFNSGCSKNKPFKNSACKRKTSAMENCTALKKGKIKNDMGEGSTDPAMMDTGSGSY